MSVSFRPEGCEDWNRHPSFSNSSALYLADEIGVDLYTSDGLVGSMDAKAFAACVVKAMDTERPYDLDEAEFRYGRLNSLAGVALRAIVAGKRVCWS